MQRQQVDPVRVGVDPSAGREGSVAEEFLDLLVQGVTSTGLYQSSQPLDRHRIALCHGPLGPEPLHQSPSAESLDHFFYARGSHCALTPLGSVVVQAFAEPAQGEGPGDVPDEG
jgi:hypothetical protein